MTPRAPLVLLLVAPLALGLSVAAARPARADTFTVTTTDDSGDGSLRDAISDANATPGNDIIVFDLPSGSTIQLANALPNVSETLDIDGNDENGNSLRITVRGADGMSFLAVNAAQRLALANLTLTNGQVTVPNLAELALLEGTYDIALFDVAADGALTVNTSVNRPVTLSGSDTTDFLGRLFFEEGTLLVTAASLPAANPTFNEGVALVDSIVFVQDTDGVFSGFIRGPVANDSASGSINKTGSGNLTLNGATIRADVFQILDGPATFTDTTSFTAQLRVASGGVLQGQSMNGRILQDGSASLINGTISPGVGVGNIATLDTELDLELRSGSVLQIDVNGPGNVDLLTANTVVIQPGATVDIRRNPGVEVNDSTILRADTSITGNFQDLEFFFFTADFELVNGNEIQLSIFDPGNTFLAFAQTDNQRAIAPILDSNDPDLVADGVFDALNDTLTVEQTPAFLDSLTGESLVAFTNARLAAKSRLDNVIESRVVGFAAQHPGLVPQAPAASLAGGAAALPQAGFLAGPRSGFHAFAPDAGEPGLGGWIDGHAVLGTVSGSGGAADLDYNVYGTTLGIDFRASENFLMGAATGYSRLEPELSGRSEEGTGNVVHGAVFGAAAWEFVHAAGWGRYAWGDYETERHIGFGLNRTARGSFNGTDFSGHGELAVRSPKLGGAVIEPFGSIDYTLLEQDGFTESGAGTLNLTVPEEDWTSLVSGAGVRLHRIFELEAGTWFVPQIHARWLHEFGDTDRRLTPTLSGVGGGTSFGPIQAAELGRDSVVGGIRWSVNSATGVHAFGDYELGWNTELLQHSFRAGFQFVF